MGIRTRERTVASLSQLGDYVDVNGGSVKGRFWTLEVSDDGGELEVGIAGSYEKRTDEEGGGTIEFTPNTDAYPLVNFAVSNEEGPFALSAVTVFSRRAIK